MEEVVSASCIKSRLKMLSAIQFNVSNLMIYPLNSHWYIFILVYFLLLGKNCPRFMLSLSLFNLNTQNMFHGDDPNLQFPGIRIPPLQYRTLYSFLLMFVALSHLGLKPT